MAKKSASKSAPNKKPVKKTNNNNDSSSTSATETTKKSTTPKSLPKEKPKVTKKSRELKNETTTEEEDDDELLLLLEQPVLSPDKVILLGIGLILVGMLGFYTLPGMIRENAGGTKLINAFYCSVITLTTIGFGDICPGDTDFYGRIFLTILPIMGLGFFCGPLLSLANSWQTQIPGGIFAVVTFTLAIGISMLTVLEGFSYTDAAHLCVITGTTIGYGNITPSSDLGRFSLALYALIVVNVMGGLLDVVRQYLEGFCKTSPSSISKPSKETKIKQQ